MNNFQTIESGQGLLKTDYGDSAVSIALKKRAQKLKEKTLIPTKDEAEGNQEEE